MQVFSCQTRDEVRIGDSISVMILDVAGDHVRLGVRSPGEFPEYREEVVYLTSPPSNRSDEFAPSDPHLVEI